MCKPQQVRFIISVLTLTLSSLAAFAEAESTFTPNVKPTIEAVRAGAGQIKIDGDLNDPIWQIAPIAGNFVETYPNDGQKPKVETEAKIAYDDRNLYIAFMAYDNPKEIRAALRSREDIMNDDFVEIYLDTYGDAAWCYEIIANPYGVQSDLRSVSDYEGDFSFDLVYETRGKITDKGYQVEMAIPFASLRFPDQDVQNWRIAFWRSYPRASRSQYSWANIDRNNPCFLCQLGTITGIKGVKAGGGLEVLPSYVATQKGQLSDISNSKSSFDEGHVINSTAVGMRYAITPSLTGEATWNPDFSQVESDAALIDANETFALFYAERRPFFQEGSDLFNTPINAVYTRMINNPIAAAKLAGRVGEQTSVAYLGAYDEDSPYIVPFEEHSALFNGGKSYTNIFRLRHNVKNENYIGVLASDRRLEGGDGAGTSVSVDGRVRFAGSYQLEMQAVLSHTAEPNRPELTSWLEGETFADGRHTATFDGESFWGNGFFAKLQRNSRTWSSNVSFSQYNPTFRTDNGFTTRNNARQVTANAGYTMRVKHGLFSRLDPRFQASQIWNYDSVVKQSWIEPGLSMNMKAQTNINVGYRLGQERFHDTNFTGIGYGYLNFFSGFSSLMTAGFDIAYGDEIVRSAQPELGTLTRYSFSANLTPLQNMTLRSSYARYRLQDAAGDDVYNGYVARLRMNYQFSRELALRFVGQYNDFRQEFSVEPLLSYQLNPLTIFYLGYNSNFQNIDGAIDNTLPYEDEGYTHTRRQVFLKVQYLFQR